MMVTAATFLAQMGGNYDGHDGHRFWAWVMVTAMIVITVAVVGGIIWAIVFATRASSRPGSSGAPSAGSAGPSARDVLDQRYARGEIETADYEERRSKLG
jgi:putative membrane protein